MSLPKERHRPLEGSSYGEMRVLSEIEYAPDISQRNLACRVGISLTLTNRLLHHMAQKGYVRVTRATWRGWLYTLTPAGFSRKMELTASYIHRFLGHYQRIRHTLRKELEPLGLHSESRVAIYGPVVDETGAARDLAELAYLGLRELGIDLVDVFAPDRADGAKFLGHPVRYVRTLTSEQYDLVVVVLPKDAVAEINQLREQGLAPEKVVTLFHRAF